MKGHVYEYDKIVAGSSLASLFYSYIHCLPLFFCESTRPYPFEAFEEDFEKGNKAEIYDYLIFCLGVSGLIHLSDKAVSIRLHDDNFLKIVAKNAKLYKIKFNELVTFQPDQIKNLVPITKKKGQYEVYDFLKLYLAGKHETKLIETSDFFLNKLHFVNGGKEIIAKSSLNEEQLKDYQHSEYYAKSKAKFVLQQNGFNSRIRVEFVKREKIDVSKQKFQKEKNINIDYRTEEEVLCQEQKILKDKLSIWSDVYPWRVDNLYLNSLGMMV